MNARRLVIGNEKAVDGEGAVGAILVDKRKPILYSSGNLIKIQISPSTLTKTNLLAPNERNNESCANNDLQHQLLFFAPCYVPFVGFFDHRQ